MTWPKVVIFALVALVVLIASIASFTQLDLDTAGTIWQGALHAVFGLIVIVGFWVTWPKRPAAKASTPRLTDGRACRD